MEAWTHPLFLDDKERLFELLKIERIALALGGDVRMQHHRQIEFGCKVIHARKRFIVGARRVALGQGGYIVMPSKDLA